MRVVVLVLAALGILWAVGFMRFIGEVASAAPARTAGQPQSVDALVVYTGGQERIASAMALLHRGVGAELLISGVHPETSESQLAALWPGAPERFECCVKLGREARTTEGNAAELADWARTAGHRRIGLVTSDYHMPRALLETRARAPDLDVTPYPVASGLAGADARPRSLDEWRRLAREYMKYLAVRLKTAFN